MDAAIKYDVKTVAADADEAADKVAMVMQELEVA